MKFEELELSTNELTLELKQAGNFKIEIPAFPCSLPFDITINLFGQKFIFESFANYYLYKIENGKANYKAFLPLVIEDSPKSFCALIGIDEVIFIDFTKKTAKKILRMYREKTDDEGFYWLSVKVRDSSFLLLYESGVARIDCCGNILWHKRMHWDDIFIKSDDSHLFYSSEYRDEYEEWKLSIEDGSEYNGW